MLPIQLSINKFGMQIIEAGKKNACTHMARDREILRRGVALPSLFFYEWDAFCVTYGLFAQPEQVLDIDFCKNHAIEVALRPTGGGIFFHENDVPFSLFIPATYQLHESFESLWEKIQKGIFLGIQEFFEEEQGEKDPSPDILGRFCQAEAHSCDFLIGEKKFGGAAFRKSKAGILCQANLFCAPFSWEKIDFCVKEKKVLQAMKKISVSLPSSIRKRLKKIVTAVISEQI